MRGRIAGLIVSAALVGACNRDKTPEVPVQQQSADSTPLTKTASPATKAPAPRPAPTPAELAAAELANAKLVRTVQVGSFPNAAEAKWWVTELRRQGIPAYTTEGSFASEPSTRLRIGAALTGAEARALADKIHARYKWPIWITTVTDKSELPANALALTRDYIR